MGFTKKRINIVIFLKTITILWIGFPSASYAKEDNVTIKIYGATDHETAVQLALQQAGTVQTVILATSQNYYDALAGVPLAIQKEAPLLYVGRTPEESQVTLEYIKK